MISFENQLKNLGIYLDIPSFWSSTDMIMPCALICSITNFYSSRSILLNSKDKKNIYGV